MLIEWRKTRTLMIVSSCLALPCLPPFVLSRSIVFFFPFRTVLNPSFLCLQFNEPSAMSGFGNLNAEAAKMFRVRKTCLKMLHKRGYVIDEEGALNMTADQFRMKFGESPSRSSLTIRGEKSDDSNDKIIVYFPEDEKVGVKPIKTYADQMREESISNGILVVKGGLTPFSKTALKEMARGGYNIEYFRDIELLVDITEHKLVPEHLVLTDQQKKELLERYRLKPNQLPRIQSIDPIARYFGMKKFQVVKIIRPSETAGRYVTYRICL